MASIWVSQLGTICTSKTFLLFSFLLLQKPLFGNSSPISNAHQRYRPAPGLGDGHGGVVDPMLLEQDDSTKMQNLLESLKEQFLRTFNLSVMGPSSLQPGSAREDPPEYMMELYNRFANDHTAMPTANIIRSFKNEDSNPSDMGVGGVRRHPLLFNVSIPHHERITAAELRLYTLVQTDRHLYAGVDRKVTIYELTSHDWFNMTAEKLMRGDEFAEIGKRTDVLELASRQVFGTDNGWEAFDLTAAVQRWSKSDGATTHRLEVHISSIANEENAESMKGTSKDEGPAEDDMRIENSPEEKHKPLLIVFSDDQSSDHRDDKRELNEMIDHETSSAVLQNDYGTESGGLWGEDRNEAEPDEEDLIQMRSNLIYDTTSRIRRNAKGNHCKKQSLYVEFKDIGWDSWILAPSGYDAFECAGICSYPLTKHVTPTKHAIIQTLVNINSPQKAARACCVPTKLEPISLLYLDEKGVVTYKYNYEGMVVAECGCR
ncbi:PREDICTED: bone morphogenetic protein 10 [Cyprinodon variegatus]|uniref:Bone morphogenetic protein 10 n=1 Tax=Cyprinodon variegatus TaxID=28743 RepID=A0A3Q2C958_CYPVA|nr:PREDICTED: bone morphogenetic protein 10 [Cyprinodon variegatus]